MRFLLIFLVVLVVAWRWRVWRESRLRERQKSQGPKPVTVGMVACHDCGVHVPSGDAVSGSLGHYCSNAHRLKREP
jgi:uncharacterized protein